jgi:ribosomal protein S27AE
MPESPDFEQIAQAAVNDLRCPRCGSHQIAVTAERDTCLSCHAFGWPSVREFMKAAIAEQLRLTWNARGAADIATIDAALPGASVKTLDALLRLLDR